MANVVGAHRRSNVSSNARQEAWQSMRVLVTFDITQILTTAAITDTNARKYLKALLGAGFIQKARGHVSGRAGSRIVYRLTRNTGPRAPIVWTDGQVFDPNTKKTYRDGEEVAPTEPYGAF